MSTLFEWHEVINAMLEARDPEKTYQQWRVPLVNAADYRRRDSFQMRGACPTKTRETAGSTASFPAESTQIWLTSYIYQAYLNIRWHKSLLCLCEYNNKEGYDSLDFEDVEYKLSPEELARLYEACWPRW
jgi:hypothetical protein